MAPPAVQVHTHEETEADRRGPRTALEHRREAATIALADKPGFDVALMEEADFQAGLERIKTRQRRLQAIIDTILVPEVHYQSKDKDGRQIFEKPHLTIAGSAELRNFFRLVCRPIEPPTFLATENFVSVSVTVGCFDNAGRLLGSRTGVCNTLERRFQKRGGGWTYADPREMTHQCTAMAEKRGAKLITAEVTGAVAFFANEDAMDRAMADAEEEIKPWTEEEKQQVFAAAKKKGLSREEFEDLCEQTLGARPVGTGDDVRRLLKAIDSWREAGGAREPGED